MKAHKAYLFLTVSVLLALSGCNLLGPEAALIGTWESTILGVTTTYVVNGDGSIVGTVAILEVGVSTTGVWNADSTSISISWEGSSESVVDYYSFNGDKSIMTLSPAAGGLSRTFTRQ
jgi:hypothetical protein